MPKINKQFPAVKLSKAAVKVLSSTPPLTPWGRSSEGMREIIYPDVIVKVAHGEKAVTLAMAKGMLGWETEEEYRNRHLKENPKINKDACIYGDDYLFKDEFGNKVRCWNCNRNRPFDEKWARKLAQDHLTRNFAGPHNMPGETINGESVIIGRTGQVLSAQHRLIGFVLACQMREKQELRWKEIWPEEPIFETVVVQGVSEDQRVVQTLDNVKPRTVSDMFYTSDLFSLLPLEQKEECSRMLQRAVGFLWKRTGAEQLAFETHSEARGFVQRHEKLLECIAHLFDQNGKGKKGGRAISILKLSPGECAGYMYLMASSSSDGGQYRTGDPRSEKNLSWDNWDTAWEFWSLMANKEDKKLSAVKDAIALNDMDSLGKRRGVSIILAKAWALFLEGKKITKEDIELHYLEKDLVRVIKDDDDFGGIDLGPKHTDAEKNMISEAEHPEPTPEEIRKEKARLASERIRQMRGLPEEVAKPTPLKLDANGKPPAPKLIRDVKLKPTTRKEVQEENTRKAKEADEQIAKEKAEKNKKPGFYRNLGK